MCEYGKILILVKLEKIKKDQGERKSMKKRKYLALLLAAGMIVQTALSTGGVVQVQAAEDTYVKTDELTDNDTAAPKKDKTKYIKIEQEFRAETHQLEKIFEVIGTPPREDLLALDDGPMKDVGCGG